MNGARTRERAKSEGKALYDDDDKSDSARDNHFTNAAKKWASYEKPVNYSAAAAAAAAASATALSRESWKRTHRKFSYSRFMSYSKETFV